MTPIRFETRSFTKSPMPWRQATDTARDGGPNAAELGPSRCDASPSKTFDRPRGPRRDIEWDVATADGGSTAAGAPVGGLSVGNVADRWCTKCALSRRTRELRTCVPRRARRAARLRAGAALRARRGAQVRIFLDEKRAAVLRSPSKRTRDFECSVRTGNRHRGCRRTVRS